MCTQPGFYTLKVFSKTKRQKRPVSPDCSQTKTFLARPQIEASKISPPNPFRFRYFILLSFIPFGFPFSPAVFNSGPVPLRLPPRSHLSPAAPLLSLSFSFQLSERPDFNKIKKETLPEEKKNDNNPPAIP